MSTADLTVYNLDHIIAGSGLKQLQEAIAFARAGSEVVLVADFGELAWELTGGLRPWAFLDEPWGEETAFLEEALRPVAETPAVDAQERLVGSDARPYVPGKLKAVLYGALKRAGVRILFGGLPIGPVFSSDDEADPVGLLMATKSGFLVVPGPVSSVAREAAAGSSPRGESQPGFRVVEYFDCATLSDRAWDGPTGPVAIHPGALDHGHYYFEFPTPLEESAAREASLAVYRFIHSRPGMRNAQIGLSSRLVARDSDRWVNQVSRINASAREAGQRAARVTGEDRTPPQVPTGTLVVHAANGRFRLDVDEEIHNRHFPTPLYRARIADTDVPQWSTADVVICGGGTGGAPAGWSAADQLRMSRGGGSVTVIEQNGLLGGTGTVGGINRYWFGNRNGFTAAVDAETRDFSSQVTSLAKIDRAWSVEGKGSMYHARLTERGVTLMYNALASQTVLKDDAVSGLVVAGASGLGAVRGRVFVDATGDADVAAAAGVPFRVGSDRGGSIQTHNLSSWEYEEDFRGKNDNPGVLDVTDPIDLSRAIAVGYEDQARSAAFDMSTFVTPRESRHIEGASVFTLADLFSQTPGPDSVVMSETDFDQHGMQGSWYARLGYMPYHEKDWYAFLPYGALVPRDIRNLLVAGRSVSCTQDASSFWRMQADVQNVGYLVGRAAALALAQNSGDVHLPPDILAELRAAQIELGSLAERPSSVNELPPLLRLVVSEGGEAESLRLWQSSSADDQLLGAKGLAWFGRTDGVPRLVDELFAFVDVPAEEDLDPLDSNRRPRGGIVEATMVEGRPSLYWRKNQLIALLGIAGDRRAVPIIRELIERTGAGPEREVNNWVHWKRVAHYDRIFTLCFAAERLASRDLVTALELLLSRPHLSGFVQGERIDADRNYASAYLELVIARALARCGGVSGVAVLEEYAGDVQTILANHARDELRAIREAGGPGSVVPVTDRSVFARG